MRIEDKKKRDSPVNRETAEESVYNVYYVYVERRSEEKLDRGSIRSSPRNGIGSILKKN